MIVVYGVLNKKNIHTDVSKTLQGAKCYATRNDYTKVSRRVGYNAHLVSERINGKWINK